VGPTQTSEPGLSFARDLPLTSAAIAFATDRHQSQRRDGDGAQFIAHPVEVAALLRRSGYPDTVVAAAVLHDVLEDTDAHDTELESRFGPEVARLVRLVSEDPAIEDEEAQKDEVRERVQRYRKSLEMLERELADEALVELLRFELEALETFPPAGSDHAA
jgi:(p)ppGpp synthase/HD superfamily hydrolase